MVKKASVVHESQRVPTGLFYKCACGMVMEFVDTVEQGRVKYTTCSHDMNPQKAGWNGFEPLNCCSDVYDIIYLSDVEKHCPDRLFRGVPHELH